MDRISALRNVEEALAEFEAGDIDLATLERRVRGVVRTYATEFETTDDEGDLGTYRATGEQPADGLVVLAGSAAEACERVADLVDGDPAFRVERVDD